MVPPVSRVLLKVSSCYKGVFLVTVLTWLWVYASIKAPRGNFTVKGAL